MGGKNRIFRVKALSGSADISNKPILHLGLKQMRESLAPLELVDGKLIMSLGTIEEYQFVNPILYINKCLGLASPVQN